MRKLKAGRGLTDIWLDLFVSFEDFNEMNEVYEEYFLHKPARSSLEAKRLPVRASMEMELVALE